MNDRQLATLIVSTLLTRVQAQPGMSAVVIARKYQARTQGVQTGPIIHFFKVGDHNHGSPSRAGTYDALAGTFTQAQSQLVETTYQFSTLIPQDPAATTALTESDVLNTLSAIIASDAVLGAFRAAGVGIQRITELRNPYFVDDRDRFEAEPSFDVVFTHYRTLSSTTPAVDTYGADIRRV